MNTLYYDAMVRRQTYLMRYSEYLARTAYAPIWDTNSRINGLIREYLNQWTGLIRPSDYRMLERLLRVVGNERANGWDVLYKTWITSLAQIPSDEAEAVGNIVKLVTGKDSSNVHLAILAAIGASTFEGRTKEDWFDSLRSNDVRILNTVIRGGLVGGLGISEIITNVNLATDTTRRALDAITRTGVAFMAAGAYSAFFISNPALATQEKFVAVLDSSTSAQCRGYSGQTFEVGKGPQPPLHIRCRSLRVALVLDGAVPIESYSQFLRRQSNEYQEQVLGKTKAKLFRDGRLPLNRFVDNNGHELSLMELARLEKQAFKAAGLDPDDY